MKKIIKTISLILFIILFIGIIPSRVNAAYNYYSDKNQKIDENTSAETMLQFLEDGYNLEGMTHKIRDINPYLMCNNRYMSFWLNGRYNFKTEEVNGQEIRDEQIFPESDEVNGHAKAYILVAPGYEKSDIIFEEPDSRDERQWAWYCINGQVPGADQDNGNALYKMALAYQNYKLNEETNIEVTTTNDTKTTFDDSNIVYGPIQIEYTYKKAEIEGKIDEWGGFNYAFFDKNGNNISDKVKLCTFSDNTYNEITSTLISSTDNTNGFYKVRTLDYRTTDANKVNLYIVINDKTISDIKVKIQENFVEYGAKIYTLYGEAKTNKGLAVCNLCMNTIKQKNLTIYNKKAYYRIAGVEGTLTTDIWSVEQIFNVNDYAGVQVATSEKALQLYGRTKDYYVEGNTSVHYETFAQAASKITFSYNGRDTSCKTCNKIFSGKYPTDTEVNAHRNTHVRKRIEYLYKQLIYKFAEYTDSKIPCNEDVGPKSGRCTGEPHSGKIENTQELILIAEDNTIHRTQEFELEIKLAASIEVTKKWNDGSNEEGVRPEDITLSVYRSIDQKNWTKLTENTDYKLEWTVKTGDEWKAIIGNLLRMDDAGNEYYFKVKEEKISDKYLVFYKSGSYIDGSVNQDTERKITITNSKLSDLGGYVWLDEQTGVKPAKPYNGIMDSNEKKLENIPVYLYCKDPNTNTFSIIRDTVTDENGYYKFEKLLVGDYYIEFEYDGINYEDTLNLENGSSKAFENSENRNKFNAKFTTIEYGKAKDGTALNYNYADRKSTLITTENGKVKPEFIMTAVTAEKTHASSVDNLNLGLVKRGADLALSTDLHDAKVSINGQETTYKYNKADNSISIGTAQSSEQASYNLSLYTSDYNYRIKNYIKHDNFKENSFINKEDTSVLGELQTLKVNIVYKLNLQNQSGSGRDVDTGDDIITTINEVIYDYDEKYKFNKELTSTYNVIDCSYNEDVLTITPNATLKPGETKTIYLVFDVKDDKITSTDTFSNKAEITKYSTSKGLIDVDSQPGNFINGSQVEDDNDTAGGLGITLGEKERKITGKVLDGSNNVNDVIVQLIELKTVDGKVYEYIWQETVSGTDKGLRLSKDGKSLEEYSYTRADGYYEFKGFIPGDYIVRFIYGDGTTYDMTNNVIKYNGQDYKSVVDRNYKAEWYNSSSYTAGQSVARDNEARRLETMAYAVDMNPVKGLLLKLLNNPTVDDLNKTEKDTLVLIYNTLYNPDISEITLEAITKVIKDEVLKNTWMCAETSKIKVTVDNSSETITNNGTPESIPVKASYDNINLGLELRPETKIELKKYITGFKLVASNGQTLVNAYIDVNEYLNGTTDISNKVQGVKDYVTILNNVWQYEVVPTEINTIVDGASIEFEYTLVVKNIGNKDYLSEEVASRYANSNIADYKTFLTTKASDVKTTMRSGKYNNYKDSQGKEQPGNIGNTIGANYYVGGTGNEKQEVLTQVTGIRDYVNNNLDFISGTKPDGSTIDLNSCSNINHRILRDDYSMQDISVKYISTGETGKMNNDGKAELYTITLGKNPISSTGNLEFDTYIAEVMSYTNAAGRRSMTSTPGNAEIIDSEKREGRTHEIDEADTGRIQVGVATGEDNKTNYIIITSVIAGIAIIAAGAFVVKKYVVK